jgi:hypothetical protein
MGEEYRKSFEDELDWNLLDELHKVVLQISNFCFYTKQICLTVDVAAIGILIKFTHNKLDTSIFVAGLLIPLAVSWTASGLDSKNGIRKSLSSVSCNV